jgi:hypothetical protein
VLSFLPAGIAYVVIGWLAGSASFVQPSPGLFAALLAVWAHAQAGWGILLGSVIAAPRTAAILCYLLAVGVALANPGAQVACVTGEGSIQMCIQEMSTCKQYHMPVKVVSLNNRYLGMVRQWQEIEYGSRYSESYMDALPDFVRLAEAYGHIGIRVDKPGDVEPALRDAFGKYKDRLVFLDVITDQTENVWPMVQGGKGLTEMILGSEDL